jgi:hypothetical protein
MSLFGHASRGGRSRLGRSLGEFQIFFVQHVFALDHFRMGNDAFDRTHFDALRLIEMTDAFGAKFGINFVKLDALINCLVRAFRLANVAIDALIGDQ